MNITSSLKDKIFKLYGKTILEEDLRYMARY